MLPILCLFIWWTEIILDLKFYFSETFPLNITDQIQIFIVIMDWDVSKKQKKDIDPIIHMVQSC